MREQENASTLASTEAIWDALKGDMTVQIKSFLFPEAFDEFKNLVKILPEPDGNIIGIDEEDCETLYRGLHYHDYCHAAIVKGSIPEILRKINFLDFSGVRTILICFFCLDDCTFDDVENLGDMVASKAETDTNIIFGVKEIKENIPECLLLWTEATDCAPISMDSPTG